MKSSETLGKLFEALAKAQEKFPVIPKNKTAKIKTRNDNDYEYNYADLSDIIAATKPMLAENGLSVTQGPSFIDGKFILVTTIGHSSGEYVSYHYPIQSFNRAQEEGSELTYKRRYALCAAIGVQSEEDKDGDLASQKGAAAQASAQKPPSGPAAAKQGPAPKPVGLPKQPASASSPVADLHCEKCGAQMKLSMAKTSYYCPNYKDKANGEHPGVKIADVQKYLAKQNSNGAQPNPRGLA